MSDELVTRTRSQRQQTNMYCLIISNSRQLVTFKKPELTVFKGLQLHICLHVYILSRVGGEKVWDLSTRAGQLYII